MPWFRIDDGFFEHPKIYLLEDGPCFAGAVSLWLLAGCWAAKYLTGGTVPRAAVRRFGVHKNAASELVRVGLWELTETGYRFKDWADYQPDADEHKAKIATKTARQKRWRQGLQARARQRDGAVYETPPVDADVDVLASTHASTIDGSETGFPIPIPIQEKISDPIIPCTASLSARAPANGNGQLPMPPKEPQEPDTNDPVPAFTQERMGRLFQREWQAARHVVPSLHCGRNPLAARELYESSVETARGRGMEPEALFLQTLRAWIPTVGKAHSPFAFFAASWTGLLSTDPGTAQREAEKILREDVEKQLREIRAGAHNASR